MDAFAVPCGYKHGTVWMRPWYGIDAYTSLVDCTWYEPNICSVWMHSRYGMDANMVRYVCGMDANMVRFGCVHGTLSMHTFIWYLVLYVVWIQAFARYGWTHSRYGMSTYMPRLTFRHPTNILTFREERSNQDQVLFVKIL